MLQQGSHSNPSRPADRSAWAGEVTGYPVRPPMAMPGPGQPQSGRASDMKHGLSQDTIAAPINAQEHYLGSLKAMLIQNVGNYIVASFQVGTQNLVSWEGILHEVGNDYIVIYQAGRNRYIVSDYYSMKFMEIYDSNGWGRCDGGPKEMWQDAWGETMP